ncbi:hypothetical protein D3C76_1862290 [compost metagenome]
MVSDTNCVSDVELGSVNCFSDLLIEEFPSSNASLKPSIVGDDIFTHVKALPTLEGW